MSKKDIKLDQYHISKEQYRELRYFCLQYPQKKKKRMTNTRSPVQEQYLKDCELIEQTAIEADSEWYQQLIAGVTEDLPWYCLRLRRGLALSEKQYNHKRRIFFYLLAKKKKMIE